MTMAPPVFGWAMLAYALSFGLAAVSQGDAAVPGYYCAFATLVNTLVMDSSLIEGKKVQFIALLISGWINIVFLASLTIRWRNENGRAFGILRTATLLMIPFCWIVFYNERLYPREGHVLWIVGMVLALFSESASSSRSMTAGSQP